MSLTFRWLGVAGIELRAGNQALVIDPFFTRPSLIQMLQPLQSDPSLVAKHLAHCNVVLVTHSHYDHLLDVPAVLSQTGAQAFGSDNTCQLLRISGVPQAQVNKARIGDHLTLGAFQVEVVRGQHSWVPLSRVFNGPLHDELQPPLRMQDYRMDICLGYRITAVGMRLLVCAAEPHPAEILLAVAQERRDYYLRLFSEIQPNTFIPIHWDDFTRPLKKPLRRFHRPGRLPLWQLTRLARQSMPHTKVIIPEIFRGYTLSPD